MTRYLLLLVLFIGVSSPDWLRAGGGPHNVAVIVNRDSWASLAVANHYIHARGIPSCNVIYLSGIDGFERIDVSKFRTTILDPILAEIKTRGLQKQITTIAYSADFPYAVDVRSDLKEADSKTIPKVLTPVGSLTGMTYLYERVLAAPQNPGELPSYLQLNANRYFRRYGTALPAVPPGVAESLQQAVLKLRNGEYVDAEKLLSEGLAKEPKNALLLYNLACTLARQGKADEAMAQLHKSIDNGFDRADIIRADKDLQALRKREDFQKVLKAVVPNFESQPSLAFQREVGWDSQGQPARSAGDAERYYLSTMLAMTSGRGNSVDEALNCIDRSVASDGNPPQGTIYFPTNGNVRSRTRQHLFPTVVSKLKARGVAAESQSGVIPQRKKDVAGAVIGTATFDWKASQSRILPGAICEHLTSFGGVLREAAGQTPLTEFIRYGAAGSSGTVTEPYAIAAKFPSAFLHVHYTAGCSLAESFCQSVSGPYQLLIVGDPLCRPWSEAPDFEVDCPVFGGNDNQTVSAPFEVRVKPAGELSHFECYVDGKRVASTQPENAAVIPVAALADGPHELAVVAVGRSAVAPQRLRAASFTVARGEHSIALDWKKVGKEKEEESPEEVEFADVLEFVARAKDATEIVLHHHGELTRAAGPALTVKLEASDLGIGPSRIWAEATLADGTKAVSSVRQIYTKRPTALSPQTPPSELKKGLQLTWQDDTSTKVATTRPSDWLAELGKPAGSKFEAVAWLEVPAEAAGASEGLLHQLQLRTNGQCSIQVDGQSIVAAKEDRWRLAPLVLKPGHHQFKIEGTVTEKPRLSIRFGRRGATSLDDRFQSEVLPD